MAIDTNYTRHAFRGFSIIFIVTILGAAISYLFRLVLARNLTVSEYGLFYSTYAAVYIIFILKDLGTTSAIIKYIPEFLVTKDYEKLKSSISIATIITISASLLLCIISFLASNLLAADYLKIPEAAGFIRLMSILFFFYAMETLVVNILVGFQKHVFYSMYQFLRQALPLLFLVILFALLGHNVTYVAYALILTSAVLIAIFVLLFDKLVFQKFWTIKSSIDKPLLAKMATYGMSAVFVSIGVLILQYTDTIMITAFLGVKSSGIYNAALPISNLIIYVSLALSTVVFPLASELWARKYYDKLSAGLTLFYRYSFMVLLPVSLMILAFAELIISILFSGEYIYAANALRFLIVGSMFYLIAQNNFSLFSGIGKPDIVAKITILAAIFNILINLWLIPAFGITGAGIATSISYTLMALSSTIILRRFVKVQIPILHWLKTLLISLLMLALIFYLKGIISMDPYLKTSIILIIAALFYCALTLAFKQTSFKEIKGLIRMYH